MHFLPDLDLWVLVPFVLAAGIAGLVRGFAGFGAGLILMPVASAIVDPRVAAAVFIITDTALTLPLIPGAVRRCHWPTVLPAAAAAVCVVPLGAWVLVTADVLVLRWGICAMILLMLVLLMSGWRYRGTPIWPASVGIGGLSGFLGGVAQIAGPPVVTYWMAGPLPAAIIRANLITFFAITTVGSIASYFVSGLFTVDTIQYVVLIAPVFALAVWLGAHGFRFASEHRFRQIAYAMIALSAITSMPALDALLRG